MTFCDNLLKSFTENLKQITKMNRFSIIFDRILHFFHGRYQFCIQKYPSKCVFIEFPSKAIALRFSRFSQKFENF